LISVAAALMLHIHADQSPRWCAFIEVMARPEIACSCLKGNLGN
jgi:hypothetical protein